MLSSFERVCVLRMTCTLVSLALCFLNEPPPPPSHPTHRTYASHMVLADGTPVVRLVQAAGVGKQAIDKLPAPLDVLCLINCAGGTAVAAVRSLFPTVKARAPGGAVAFGKPLLGARIVVFGAGWLRSTPPPFLSLRLSVSRVPTCSIHRSIYSHFSLSFLCLFPSNTLTHAHTPLSYACTWIGPLGILSAVYARDTCGAETVIVDPNQKSREAAAAFGLQALPSLEAFDQEFDAAIEACGAVAAVPPALSALRYGGVLSLVGLVHPHSSLGCITAEQIIRRCLTLVGVHNYSPSDLAEAVTFVPETWHTHPKGFEALGLGGRYGQGTPLVCLLVIVIPLFHMVYTHHIHDAFTHYTETSAVFRLRV